MVSSPEDVFLLRTKDGKSPEIYALFSTIRWVVQLQPLQISSCSHPRPAQSQSPHGCWLLLNLCQLCPGPYGDVGSPMPPINAAGTGHGPAHTIHHPLSAMSSRAPLSVCTAWPTSGRSSMGPSPTGRPPTTSGVPTRAGCPTHGQAW